MKKSDKALDILRNRIYEYESGGGIENKKLQERLNKIISTKNEMINQLTTYKFRSYKCYRVSVKSKVGKFNIMFHSPQADETAEEIKIKKKLSELRNERAAVCRTLRRKLDDISLKINIVGLDSDTTKLLTDFMEELEKIQK